jgi:hypothetical protein
MAGEEEHDEDEDEDEAASRLLWLAQSSAAVAS